jgi:polysaccharide export outer membrane protein
VLSSLASSIALVSGCSNQMSFPVNASASRDLAARNVEVIPITSENIRFYTDASWLRLNGLGNNPPTDPGVYSYRIGSGDQLRIATWTTPERSAGSDVANIVEGPIVNEAGEFFYPFVGMTRARGLTVTEIRRNLETALREFIADPQVEVAVQNYRAHQVTITGAISSPGSTTLTNVPLRLLDLANTSGITERSDLRHVIIRRQGREYMVNLLAFMEQGLPNHNPILLPNDIIFVPAMADNRVFTFGEIGVGEIRLGPERKTLTEVLAARGGPSRLRADARGIFVFRAVPGQPESFIVFQFNLLDATALMLTSQFAMAPMDVVFVTTDPITRWNDTVGRILTPVSGVIRTRSIIEDVIE